MGYDWDRHELSRVRGPRDAHVNIAIRPERLDEDGDLVQWFQPCHQRRFMVGEVIFDHPNRFVFLDEKSRRFELTPLTLADYRRHVRPTLDGAPAFANGKELRRFFLETIWQFG